MADPTTAISGAGVETRYANLDGATRAPLIEGQALVLNSNPSQANNTFPPIRLPEIEFPSRNALRFAATSQPLLPPIDLKVITVNAYLYHSGSPVIDLFFDTPNTMQRAAQLAAWIKAQDADIVFLQEVWHQPLWREVARLSGFTSALHFGNLGSGNTDLAILSNHPLSNPRFNPTTWQGSKTHECGKDLGGDFRTGLATVTARIKGRSVLLANAHPMHRRHDEANFSSPASELTPERVLQIIELWSFLKPQVVENRPLIFGGDFNFQKGQQEEDVFRRLFSPLHLSDSTDILVAHGGPKTCTFCEDNPINKENEVPGEGILDRVFVNNQVELVDAEIATPNPVFTDHQPLITHLRLAAPNLEEMLTRPSSTNRPKSLPTEPLPMAQLVVPLTDEEIRNLSAYLDQVSFSFPACLFSDFGDDNVAGARAFLGRLTPLPSEDLLARLSSR